MSSSHKTGKPLRKGSSDENLVLIVGALGIIGKSLLSELLDKNYSVRIIARSLDLAKRMLPEAVYSRLESVHISDIERESYFVSNKKKGSEEFFCSSDLVKAFLPNEKTKTKVKYLISIIGMNSYNHNSELIDYEANKLLIDLAECYEIKKFIYLSSVYVAKPFHPTSLLMNSFMDSILSNKMRTEKYLRNVKGMKYVIVRPGTLFDDKKPTAFSFGHRSKNSAGSISRQTLSKILFNVVEDQKMNNLTFSCTSSQSELRQEYFWLPHKQKFLYQEDTLMNERIVDHKTALKAVLITFLSIITFLFLFIMRDNINRFLLLFNGIKK